MEAVATIGLSSAVKFSEVYLWDDVMDCNPKAAYRQNKKVYFLSDDKGDISKEENEDLEVDYPENVHEVVMEEAAYKMNKKTYFHSDDEDVAADKDGDKGLKVESMDSVREVVMEEAAYKMNKKIYFHSDDEDEAADKDGDNGLKVESMDSVREVVMEEAAYKMNKKTYFHSDDEDEAADKDGDKGLKVESMDSGCGIAMKEAELSQQMNAMGLPLSFNSSKNTNGSHRGSRKNNHLKLSQSYRHYADAVALAGSFRVSAVNTSDPNSNYLELKELVELTSTITDKDTNGLLSKRSADYLTDDYPVLTECSSKNTKKIVLDDLGIDPATVLSYPDAVTIDDKLELDNELGHEYVQASTTSEHPGEVPQFSNGVEKLVVASNQSSEALEDSEWNDNSCYGEFEDWRIYWDNDYQQYYYFNINTTESTWEPPPVMELQPPDDMVISQEPAVNDSISGIDCKLMDEDKPHGYCTGSIGDAAYCVTHDHQNISRLPLANEMNMDDFDVNLSPDCDKLLGEHELSERYNEASVRKKKQSKKPRARRSSSGNVTKYWCQRYYLFSRFDDGIKMDNEGWYSVTPEKIAEHHASRCGSGIILDLFTGVGGNAIQFAHRSELVIAIDIDPCRIAYARHNAAIYGVNNWIDFIQGDSFAIAPMLKADTVFLSPPWGGPEYARSDVYDLKSMLKPYDGYYLFNSVKHISPHIVMFLPRNVDVGQLVEMAVTSTPPWSLEVEKNFLNGKLKAVTAYFRATES